jgi:hypothetical protein
MATLNGKTMWRVGNRGGKTIRRGLETGIRSGVAYGYTCGTTTGKTVTPLKRRRG